MASSLFTDLEASTDTTTRLGDATAAFFATHDRIVREQFEAHGGRRVKSTGDGFLALFDSARSAVACALAIQRELAAQEGGRRVRIGVNAGEVREDDRELFGRGDQPRGACDGPRRRRRDPRDRHRAAARGHHARRRC
jgi:class 3 adenylate cyclase